MPVDIHGKPYYTVAERVKELHEKVGTDARIVIETKVINWEPVTVKATVSIGENTFTGISGISAATANKMIEKSAPVEVAETSAIGRALGFAGFGAVDSIATADEIVKANYAEKAFSTPPPAEKVATEAQQCEKCGSMNTVTKTVVKEGPNKGRQFVYCQENEEFSHFRD